MSISPFAFEEADEIIPLQKSDGTTIGDLSISFRPYLFEFLEDMQSQFELVLYGSCNEDYMRAIKGALERRGKYFTYYFNEDFCIFANIAYSVKCINFLFSNRSPSDIIVVDNSVKSFPLSIENVVPISYFEGNDINDHELANLGALLEKLSGEKDVREGITKYNISF